MLRLAGRPGIYAGMLIALSLLLLTTPALASVFLPPVAYPCNVEFSADPTSGFAPLPVRFTDETDPAWCSDSPVSGEDAGRTDGTCGWTVTWDFGDGHTAVRHHDGPTERVPPFNTTHTYKEPGEYTVSLTYDWICEGVKVAGFLPFDFLATGDAPSKFYVYSETRELYITVLEPRPEKADERTLDPAQMTVSYLSIDPLQVLPNQEVVISANVCNGGEEGGSKTATLLVNGEAAGSQSVSVSGGACKQVVFSVSRAVPGMYQVVVDGMEGQFSVLAPRTVTNTVPSQQSVGLGTAGIVAVIAVLVVLVIALVMVFRKD